MLQTQGVKEDGGGDASARENIQPPTRRWGISQRETNREKQVPELVTKDPATNNREKKVPETLLKGLRRK